MTLEETLTPEKFVDERVSHNSVDEFFDSLKISKDNYRPTHLSITLIESPSLEFSYHAELALAEKAIQRGCKYLTNLDYCQADYDKGRLILACTGWLPLDSLDTKESNKKLRPANNVAITEGPADRSLLD